MGFYIAFIVIAVIIAFIIEIINPSSAGKKPQKKNQQNYIIDENGEIIWLGKKK